ncbi:MAG TPA: sulfatase-like hydrolase/transferase [bacterium]|nr:sulfatase-like hydrolase/transferase [bacterium]
MAEKSGGWIGRREFVKAAGMGAGVLAAAGVPGLGRADERPNVLLVLVDQWRMPRWFPAGAELPGFERLSREGLTFTNHFVSAVPCSPSRACLFTGLHLTQHNIQTNVNFNMSPSLDPRIPTLAHRFSAAGYRTPYFGKWHLTEPRDYRGRGLTAYGFEAWHGPDHQGTPHDGTLNDPRYARQSINWLRLHGKKAPWFLTCSLINPHDICFYRRLDAPSIMVPRASDRLPGNFHDDLTTKPRIQAVYREGYGKLMGTQTSEPERVWLRYLDYYLYYCQMVDKQIKRLLDALDRLKLSDNTIVVFTADHGDMCGSHQLQAKGPFVYQENNNVPLVFRWPGRVNAGAESSALSHNPDVFPTLLDLCGVSAPVDYLPGRSIASLVRDPAAAPVRDHVLMGFGMKLGSNNALAKLGARSGISAEGVPMQIRAIHDGRYKYARYFDDNLASEFELYDLQEDPLELRNLAGDPGYNKLQQEMAARLEEAEAREMAPLPEDVKLKS